MDVKRVKNVIKKVVFIIGICLLLNSLSKDVVYNEYIDESAETLTSELDNIYYSWFYNIMEVSKNEAVVRYCMMGGNVRLGTLSVINNTTLNIQAEKRNGDIKLLLIDDASEEVVFFDNIINNYNDFSLEKGVYQVYLVGSWFSGKFSMTFSDALFEDYNS
ncbi:MULTISPECIES: hypothetical protein [unclassified Sedimentibacter]|uniref:hypothetical protein n=1 Tax=unclassified Sedimentibacter TaxID=2649220 RepID=UPI0027DF795F|nr:hypothetical protein [Sedimentibacter sp. MB35-C1]WMJ75959.1 hypothetical protein RBQ61_09980 [Sedimentibacter sp. MB35-C1]